MTELIVVLDMDTCEEALQTVERCGACSWFKIGSQLFTRCGPEIVREIQARDKQIMLDLKFHDIPNTVAHSASSARALNADMFTLHASGGRKMIAAAREAVEGSATKILAVTILTSFSDAALREDLNLQESAAEAVVRLARLAVGAGAHGIVCSPQEIGLVRDAVGPEPLIVTPGIRPAWSAKDDQERIMTPSQAAAAGASHIVVGRPILKHENLAEAVELIRQELTG